MNRSSWSLHFLALVFLATAALAAPDQPRRMPVILDTDIGTDIDDTWALGVLLKSPELDLKLVVTDYGKVNYRPRVVAKFLEGDERRVQRAGQRERRRVDRMSGTGRNERSPPE